MNVTSARLLRLLIHEPIKTGKLCGLLKIKNRQLSYIIRDLIKQNYIEKKGATIRLADTANAILFRDVTQTVDTEKLLRGSNETVLCSMEKNDTIDCLIEKSGLSKATVYKSVSDLRSIGAVLKDENLLNINGSSEKLVLFVKLLKIQKEKRYEGSTETIHDDSVILRKVPSGGSARGQATGFMLFSDYGVKYNTIHDYFCEQKEPLDISDVLLHAVYAASHSKDKLGLAVAMVFYLKHKEKMDNATLRKKASRLGISQVWLDVESYLNKQELKNPDMFLPWDEFMTKVRLYDIPAAQYMPPKPSNSLFREISGKLEEPQTVYLFGEENMRLKALKNSTKDCDIVLEDKKSFEDLAKSLTGIGYVGTLGAGYSDTDKRIRPDGIFVHENKSRIDLFTSSIMQNLVLSKTMKARADIRDYGRLKLGLLCNEDVFLLKAVANREGDIQDMAALVRNEPNTSQPQHGPFDWRTVWDEMIKQEQASCKDFTQTIFDQLSYLAEQTGIDVPFLDKLRRHVVGKMIQRLLRGGSMSIKEVVDWLKGGDITEALVRNRIDALARSKVIKKSPNGKTTRLKLARNNQYEKNTKITFPSFKTWLDWRFPIRGKPPDRPIKQLVKEIKDLGFQNIGEVDEIVRHSTGTLEQYEDEKFSRRHFDVVGAVRVCIGLHYPKLGNNRSSKYFVSEFKKYHSMARKIFTPHPTNDIPQS